MDALNDTGKKVFFTEISELVGNVSQRFNTIQDIKANKNLLTTIGNEEYSKKIYDKHKRLSNIEEKIIERGHKPHNYLMARNNLGYAISE